MRSSAPQKVHVDNTPPPTPVITLQLKTPSGQLKDLKCGKVKKGDGLIRITIQATDPNFSRCGVAAQGNSSLSVPIEAVPDPPGVGPTVPLSKVYNFNVADTGYPVPTSFLWDPWSDPRIVPCCYVVRIDIWDRAVINNHWLGGHGNSGWEAIEIGLLRSCAAGAITALLDLTGAVIALRSNLAKSGQEDVLISPRFANRAMCSPARNASA